MEQIQIYQLPAIDKIQDDSVFLIEIDEVTYRVSGKAIVDYIKLHKDMLDTYIPITLVGEINGIAPLNSEKKLDSNYLTFGKVKNTIYDGNNGKLLEDALGEHCSDFSNSHKVTAEQVGLGRVENKTSSEILSDLSAENIKSALGYNPEIDGTYEQCIAYTDLKISELVNGAPDTLNTLKEISDAMSEQSDILEVLNQAIEKKANELEFVSHTNDNAVHVTQAKQDNWDAAFQHKNSEHARTDATNVTKSTINGNVKINGIESVIYQHPLSGVTAGTYRQITVDNQGHVVSGNNTTLPITQGGTGAITSSQALINLGISATAQELNKLEGCTISTDEINQLNGVTGSIQSQLNSKAPIDHGIHVPISSEGTNNMLLSSNGVDAEWKSLTKQDIVNALGYLPGEQNIVITAVKGDAETEYQTGNVNITPKKIGLGKVNNTADNEKSVLSAAKLSSTRKIGNADFNGSSDITLADMGASEAGHTHDEYCTIDNLTKVENNLHNEIIDAEGHINDVQSVLNDLTDKINGYSFRKMTASKYNELDIKDSNTIYFTT